MVDERHDRRVALADAGGLDDDQVEAGRLHDGNDVGERVGQLVRAAGGERAEEHPVAVEGVHADAVAEQGAATTTTRGVDGDDGDAELVLLVDPQATHELVGERALARAAGAGDAEHGGAVGGGALEDAGAGVIGEPPGLGRREGASDRRPVAREQGVDVERAEIIEVEGARFDDLGDHAGQAEPLAVLGAEDRDAGLAQSRDLLGHDDAATTADDLDVAGALGAQRLHEVLEVLDVAALVARDRDALHVLLDRGRDDLGDRAVVPEVDDFGALRLHDAPHDVDARVMTVEQGGRGDEANGGTIARAAGAHAGSTPGDQVLGSPIL